METLMRFPRWVQLGQSALFLLLWTSGLATAEIQITLKNDFIEQYKDRATIEATYTVDKAHAKPNAPAKDGDMHVAGRAPEIGLSTARQS